MFGNNGLNYAKEHPLYWECKKCGIIMCIPCDTVPRRGMCSKCNNREDDVLIQRQLELKAKYLE
jgi:Zn finger protein HypA/HybF involved in hydrogenase expression